MVEKRELIKSDEYNELTLAHADVVNMCNDPTVMLDGGTVSESQEFMVLFRKSNGSEMLLSQRNFKPGDKLVFRFTKYYPIGGDTTFADVEVT